jgi:hypothetical protein
MQFTSEDLVALRRMVARAEHSTAHIPDEFAEVAPADLVQIRPSADPVFGGMLVAVTRADSAQVRGYLLRPHRGGCREAWLRLNHCEVERVGRMAWPPDSDFAMRRWCRDARVCPVTGR